MYANCPDTSSLPDISQRQSPVENIGLVLSTCGTVPYVHLQLENAARMFGRGGIPILVVNDGDEPRQGADKLAALCEEYGVEFQAFPYAGHCCGDLRAIVTGLRWADEHNIQLLAKFSRRFIPLVPWRYKLLAAAATNRRAAAFSRFHNDRQGTLFRTDGIVFRVGKWMAPEVMSVFDETLELGRQNVHVENMIWSQVKTIGGWELWDLHGPDFYRAHQDVMQWRGCLPCHYGDLARAFSLPYNDDDFDGKPGDGVLIQQECAKPDEQTLEACRKYSDRMNDDNAVVAARLMEFDQRVKSDQLASDIREHMATIRDYAAKCDVVTEFGVRTANSTLAMLCGCPKKLIAYDLFISPSTNIIHQLAGKTQVALITASSLEVEIEPTDLLMIDSLHTYEQLHEELSKHSANVRKYIIMHDTESYGKKGEDGSEPGLRQAIKDFLESQYGVWDIERDDKNCNGLMVLRRKEADGGSDAGIDV